MFYRETEFSLSDDIRFLRKYSTYDSNNEKLRFVFQNKNHPELKEIYDYFKLDLILGKGNDLERISNLKKWAYQNLNWAGKMISDRSLDQLGFFDIIATAKTNGYSLNCRYISLLFTQILLSAGFKARWVGCLPMEFNYSECHCVTEVYVESLKKWIIADASFGVFYFNQEGIPINLYELRQLIIDNKKPRIIISGKKKTFDIVDYWIRRVFRFRFMIKNEYDMLKASNIEYAILNPKDFIMDDKCVTNGFGQEISYKYYYDYRTFWEE